MACLQALVRAQTWRMLRAIAYTHEWAFSAQWHKVEAAKYILDNLDEMIASPRALKLLSDSERSALIALRLAGGALPWHQFIKHFGEARTNLHWRKYDTDAPWHRPISDFEHLLYLGYVYIETTPFERLVILPDELSLQLPEPVPEPLVGTVHRAEVADPLLDIVHVLTYLQGQDVRLIAGRWLPPSHYRTINTMLITPDPTVATARSELQTGYLCFLHYLADTSHLVAPVRGILKPTPKAWDWVSGTEADRVHTLRKGWEEDLAGFPPEDTRWNRYRLPSGPAMMSSLMRLLESLPPGSYTLRQLEEMLIPYCIIADAMPFEGGLVKPLSELLHGPLTWLGWVTCSDRETIDIASPGEFRDSVPTQVPEPACEPACLTVYADRQLVLTLPEPPARPPLVPLLSLALPAPRLTSHTTSTLQRVLTRELVAELLSRGFGLQWLITHLQELTGGPLRGDIIARLQNWEHHIRSLRLRRMTVLTLSRTELIDEALASRRARDLIAETLSPHHLAIRSDAVDKLLRQLQRRRYTPLVDASIRIRLDDTPAAPVGTDTLSLDRGAVAQLWLALRITIGLSDLVNLPTTPSAGLLHDLGSFLGEDVVQLEAMACRTDKALRGAIDGYGPFPSPLPDTDPEAIADALDMALEEQRPVEIVYHTTGRGERTTRVVEPLRMEERGGARYLYAYCRLRQEERVFRLDRIERAEVFADR